jgi:hypothetical protein
LVDANTLRSARLMRILETQFSEAKPIIDIHLHDDKYYEKSICDLKYFSLTHMGSGIGPDADLIDGKHYNELIGSLLPPGIGFAWNGTDTDVPSGWHIGDGSTQNGIVLPETRGLFSMMAGSVHTARSTGGASSLSNAGGTVTIGGHIVDLTEIPPHYHDWVDTRPQGLSHAYDGGYTSNVLSLNETHPNINSLYNHDAADEEHIHGTKTITFNAFSILPAWLAKYIIFKV